MTTSASVAVVSPSQWHLIPGGLGPRQAIAWNIVGFPTEDGRFSVDGAPQAVP